LAAKVFTLKNPVFSHHLFEDLLKGRITAVDINNYNIIPAKKTMGYGSASVQVADYDSLGDITGYKTVQPEVNIDSFYKYSINQHFYFDNVNNILYSQVNYMDVYKKIYTSQGVYLGEAPLFRVYFVRPALYKKPEVKHFLD
jgi:hypothetical protein